MIRLFWHQKTLVSEVRVEAQSYTTDQAHLVPL